MSEAGDAAARDDGDVIPPRAQPTYQITPPGPFSFANPAEWPRWYRRFDRFRRASGLATQPSGEQVNTLIYSMGDQAEDIIHSFHLTEEQSGDYDVIVTRLENHFIVRRHTVFERLRFYSRTQEEGETVDEFVTALHALSKHCNFAAMHEEMLRDRVIVGIRDRNLAEKLTMDDTLTLHRAVQQARHTEAVRHQQASLVRHSVL